MSNPFFSGRAQVIQGRFVGNGPTFVVQAQPHFGNVAQRQMAPHVQAVYSGESERPKRAK